VRRASPEELNEDARPIALLRLSKDRLEELFPIELSDADPLSTAEPSIGGLVQLNSGPYAVVIYGKITGETEVSLPVSAPMARHWAAFLCEVPLGAKEIVWTSDRIANARSQGSLTQIGNIIERRSLAHASPSDTVRAVAKKMSDRNIGAIAVLDSGRLVGIFSERDVMRRIVAEGRNPDETRVDAVMTKDLIVAAPGDDIDDALLRMHSCNCRHLPVVDRGHFLGMVSMGDLLQIDVDNSRARAILLLELVTESRDYEN